MVGGMKVKCMVREKDADIALFLGKLKESRYRYNAEDSEVYLEIIVEKGWCYDKDKCRAYKKR